MTLIPLNQSRWAKFLTKPAVKLPARYGFAVVIVALAFELREAITAWAGPGFRVYLTFYPAIMVVALLAGCGPGLLATSL